MTSSTIKSMPMIFLFVPIEYDLDMFLFFLIQNKFSNEWSTIFVAQIFQWELEKILLKNSRKWNLFKFRERNLCRFPFCKKNRNTHPGMPVILVITHLFISQVINSCQKKSILVKRTYFLWLSLIYQLTKLHESYQIFCLS